ncbi:MAG: hypothetical protein ACLSVD_15950 [Eggerthellaceae bacterium]
MPGMNLAVGEGRPRERAGRHLSDDAVETKPNFVITVDPALRRPDDTAVEARAAGWPRQDREEGVNPRLRAPLLPARRVLRTARTGGAVFRSAASSGSYDAP